VSSKKWDILTRMPEPKRIAQQTPVVAGDKANPALAISITVFISPDNIEMAVRNALSQGVSKDVVLRLLYVLSDRVEKLIGELERS